jgi:hypothetical protein
MTTYEGQVIQPLIHCCQVNIMVILLHASTE